MVQIPEVCRGFHRRFHHLLFLLDRGRAKVVTGITAPLRGWWFTLAFLCIGLDTKFSELIARAAEDLQQPF